MLLEPTVRGVMPMSSITRWVGGEGGSRTPKLPLSPFQTLNAAAHAPIEICCTRLLYRRPSRSYAPRDKAVPFANSAPTAYTTTWRRFRELTMDELDRFYCLLKTGTSVGEFLRSYEALFPFIHSNGLTPKYRLGKDRLKKLRDEVTLAVPFIRQHAAANDTIQFPLDSSEHDCNFWHREPARHRTVQFTVVQGQERFYVTTELNDTGCGRGFLGLTDDNPRRDFKKQMGQEREMYSTEQARTTLIHAFRLCAEKKRDSQSNTLVIGAPLNVIPLSRWMELQPELAEPFRGLRFCEVYVVSDDDEFCWQLK